MARPVKRNYGKWRVSDLRPLPLVSIPEEQHSNSNSDNAADPFDKLLKSPLKRDLDFKPLSHWAKKVVELSSKEKKSKAKELYDFSSPDETVPSTKKKGRKPKPRKKKENLVDHIYKTSVRGIKKKDLPNGAREVKKNRPVLTAIENKALNSLVLKAENTCEQSLLSFKHPPTFGLSSTPDQGKRQKLVKPSHFDFVSPITSQRTPFSLSATPFKKSPPTADCDETPKRHNSISPVLSDGNLADDSEDCMTPGEKSGFRGFSTHDLLKVPVFDIRQQAALLSNKSPAWDRNVTRRRKYGHSSLESTGITGDESKSLAIDELSNESPARDRFVTHRRKYVHSSLESTGITGDGRKSLAIDELSNKSPAWDRNVTRRRKNLQSSLESTGITGDEGKSLAIDEFSNKSPAWDRNVTRRRKNLQSSLESSELSNDSKTLESPRSILRSSFKEREISPNDKNLTPIRKNVSFQSSVLEFPHNDSDMLRNISASELCSSVEDVKESTQLNEKSSSPECAKLSDLSDGEILPESKVSASSIIGSDSTDDSEFCRATPKKYPTKRRKRSVKPNPENGVEDSLPKKRSTIVQPAVVSDAERSRYFVTRIEETSPSDDDDELNDRSSSENETKTEKTVVAASDDEPREASPVVNRTLLPCGPTVLKGGKSHMRALSVIRQIQAGRLTMHNQSIMTLPGRGRGYETFVVSLLESQPGFEESILRTASPDKRKSRFSRTRSSALARQSTVQNSHVRNLLTPGVFNERNGNAWNQTIKWRDSVVNRTMNATQMNRTHMCNVSVCVVAAEKHEPTAFRAAYEIEDAVEAVQSSARDVILARCGQDEPLDFSEYFNEETLPDCVKIGEGVYGEVFMYNSKEYGSTVFKVIPIEGDMLVNDEPQKTFKEILSEVVSTMELSNLRYGTKQNCSGFTELRKCWCVKGEFPELLLDLWCQYDVKNCSDNDSPSNFEEDQLYIVLELAHGGQDLESFVFQNAKQSAAAFRQAALSLAVAERALQFEHRDFHWGNVLLSATADPKVKYILDGNEYILPTEGVKVTIIDFTLSRMTFEGCSVFNDLSVDPTLFTSEGEYQFEIYRMMKEETGNNWELFKPRTNIFWLHYTLDKLTTIVRYKRPKSKLHVDGVKKLNKWKNSALDFGSATELVPSL